MTRALAELGATSSENEMHTALQELVEANKDAAAWFRIVANQSFDAPNLILSFNTLSEERRVFAVELEAVAQAAGRQSSGSALRIVSRAFRDTLSLTSSDATDLNTRMQSTKELESRCLETYAAALKLPWREDLRVLLASQRQAIAERV